MFITIVRENLNPLWRQLAIEQLMKNHRITKEKTWLIEEGIKMIFKSSIGSEALAR